MSPGRMGISSVIMTGLKQLISEQCEHETQYYEKCNNNH